MNILEYMKEHLLVLDGGMGTLLQAAGLAAGDLPSVTSTAIICVREATSSTPIPLVPTR